MAHGISKEQRKEQQKKKQEEASPVKKSSAIHYMEIGDDIKFHVGYWKEEKVHVWTKNKFYSCFPKEPYHGIKDPKWAEFLDKNDKACKEFAKTYG